MVQISKSKLRELDASKLSNEEFRELKNLNITGHARESVLLTAHERQHGKREEKRADKELGEKEYQLFRDHVTGRADNSRQLKKLIDDSIEYGDG